MALIQHWSDGREDALEDTASSLLAASASGDERRVASLLQQGAEVDVVLANRFFGETPCEQALEHGHVEVAELLLSALLSQPQGAQHISELFWRRLLSAALRSHQLSVLGFVLSYEPDLNSDVRHSEKPLFDAARADEAEMLKVLLAHGADASGTDPVGSTLLHIAAKYRAMNVLEVLNASSVREDVNVGDSLFNTALHYAADGGQVEVAKVLFEMGADANLSNRRLTTPLHMAVSKAKFRMAKLLLEEGQADADARDFQGNTALLLLAAMSSSDMDENVSDSEEEEESVQLQMAKLLIEYGADVNAANTATATPLHCAMRRYDFDLVDLLLATGADVNLRNRFGDTPLHQAARLAMYPVMWEKLLKHGANLTAEDREGQTPMELIPNNVLRASVAEVVASLTDPKSHK
ncbi:Ankyrin repeats (3 copies) [Phytophthora infestans]|uniref:Ankyrin repeats (3 copies) n=1 Tax=Phytophthora infestans TaxID=4787 RepID=A0A833STC3_PHYIN|nr:Ankyrin repeats (3 copies) [Phytophthora infestans]KAF4146040.1 Ankyrin repeats domain-containing protein [Phytophthora infestans]